METKLFLIESDYVKAPSEEEAIAFYKDLTGEEDLEIEEIPKKDWSKKTVTTEETEIDEAGKLQYIKFTFKEWLDQFSDTPICIVASTEC